MKDGESLIRAENSENLDQHAAGLWANDENSVGDVRLPDLIVSNGVSDGM